MSAGRDHFAALQGQKFLTLLADPPWRFKNRTGKIAPEHGRLRRYATMSIDEILALPVAEIIEEPANAYIWTPNSLLPDGIKVLEALGFEYKTALTWYKVREDGGPDGRGCGFYFRNVKETVLFAYAGRAPAPSRRADAR
jgi:N6-adenosine-specific RNA methylase IME4